MNCFDLVYEFLAILVYLGDPYDNDNGAVFLKNALKKKNSAGGPTTALGYHVERPAHAHCHWSYGRSQPYRLPCLERRYHYQVGPPS